ncbi:GUN4 domain-containing protein [Microcoleus sp. w1-18aA5]|uniref:GUN4 domain-containing protein n=1 Tax=Microcoleus sp. w1-18aA5 TaxID=2818982 RepID=UPI002FD2DF84
MWILILIVLAVVVYFVVSQASSSNQASKASSRTQASKASSQNYTNQVDYSNLEVISLDSSVSIHYNYTHLRDLLAEGKWKEADEETGKMMIRVSAVTAHKKLASEEYDLVISESRFNPAAAEHVPCEDLCTIDRLWLKYSNGRFGFSVQRRIISELGEDELSILSDKTSGSRNYSSRFVQQPSCTLSHNFLKRIGWHTKFSDGSDGNTIDYNDLTFAIEAPYGHLPTANYGEGGLYNPSKSLNQAVSLYVLNRFSICGIAL